MKSTYLALGFVIGNIVCMSSAAAADATIGTSGFDFVPSDVTIDVGDTVTWTNLQPTHNVAESDSPASNMWNGTGFRSGNLGDVDTYQQTFATPGVLYFICEPHAGVGMKGSITVMAPALPVSGKTGILLALCVMAAFGSLSLYRLSRQPG